MCFGIPRGIVDYVYNLEGGDCMHCIDTNRWSAIAGDLADPRVDRVSFFR